MGKTTRTLLSSRFSFCGYTSFLPLWSLIALEMPPRSNLESKLSEEQGPSLFILLQSALHTCGAREIMNNNNCVQPIWPLGPASGCKSIIWSSKAEITHCLPLTGSVWGAQSCNSAEKQWNEPQNLELDFVFFFRVSRDLFQSCRDLGTKARCCFAILPLPFQRRVWTFGPPRCGCFKYFHSYWRDLLPRSLSF